jgi:4-hydroxybenzoate polyprenyltransferase
LHAALRIVWEAALYRVKRREANNVLTSCSLMLALGLAPADLVYRTLYALLLNVYIYLMNDYYDIELDLASPQKDQAKARFMAEHRGAARGALVGLAALGAGAALVHSSVLVVAFVVNSAVVLVYSAWLKRWPLVDLVMMGLWGVTMALVALPEGALPDAIGSLLPARIQLTGLAQGAASAAQIALAWKLLGLLGLLCAAFEAIQVVRDEPGDRATAIVTTAVLLGVRGAAWLFRAIVVGAALYGWLAIGSPLALALGLALALPLTPERADRTWDLCRLLFGLVWVALLAAAWAGRLSWPLPPG